MAGPLALRARALLMAWPALALIGCPLDDRNLDEEEASPSGGQAGTSSARGGNAGKGGSGGGRAGGPGGGETGSELGGEGGTGEGGAQGGAGGDSGVGGCGDLDDNGVEDCSETAVENPGFDQDTLPWEVDSSVTQTWDPRKARSTGASGALSIVNETVADASIKSMAGSRQCIPAWGNVTYSVGARVFIPNGQGVGEAGINIAFYGAEGCTDYLLDTVDTDRKSAAGTWSVVRGEFEAPPATRSMYVRLVAIKPFSEPPIEVLFDNVLVREQ